ncbi:hypothetical protein [Stieleria magnilauensis]|uniref:Uncharacterized protein n=1 Tax=Stieleria magnilauensis TaxID=2527963 RepID=A0ABX5XST4_9BACT|nr:hypothetical protein TBK1r_40180 [Planctomycetes bacterium TBK1r]
MQLDQTDFVWYLCEIVRRILPGCLVVAVATIAILPVQEERR